MNLLNHTYRLIAFSLALLMLVTSLGLTLDMHFCGDHLKSYSFFGKAKGCYEMSEGANKNTCSNDQMNMEQNDDCSIQKKNCCDNKTLDFQFDQDQQIQTADLSISQSLQQFITAYVAVFFLNDFQIESDKPSFAHYKSPLIARDIYVLDEAFLL